MSLWTNSHVRPSQPTTSLRVLLVRVEQRSSLLAFTKQGHSHTVWRQIHISLMHQWDFSAVQSFFVVDNQVYLFWLPNNLTSEKSYQLLHPKVSPVIDTLPYSHQFVPRPWLVMTPCSAVISYLSHHISSIYWNSVSFKIYSKNWLMRSRHPLWPLVRRCKPGQYDSWGNNSNTHRQS